MRPPSERGRDPSRTDRPCVREVGWGVVADSRMRLEVICPGRIEGAGHRGKSDVADYVLTYRNHKLAVIEAKAVTSPNRRRGSSQGVAASSARRTATYMTCWRYIAFSLAPIARSERVEARRSEIFSHYESKLQAFLDFVLGQYVKQGVDELDQEKLASLLQLKYHTVDDALVQLGSAAAIRDAFVGFQQYLYSDRK